MPNSLVLPLIAGLSIAGAAVGVQLGHSAISEIDPSLFSEPEESFHAALAPYQSPDWAQVQQAEYQQPPPVTQPEMMPQACVGCVTWPIELGPQPSAAAPQAYRVAPEPSARRRSADAAPVVVVEEAPDPARERIARYSSFPVSAEEADASTPDEDDAATQ
jgi:hypothetical protein